MKKVIIIMLLSLFAGALTACGGDGDSDNGQKSQLQQPQDNNGQSGDIKGTNGNGGSSNGTTNGSQNGDTKVNGDSSNGSTDQDTR